MKLNEQEYTDLCAALAGGMAIFAAGMVLLGLYIKFVW